MEIEELLENLKLLPAPELNQKKITIFEDGSGKINAKGINGFCFESVEDLEMKLDQRIKSLGFKNIVYTFDLFREWRKENLFEYILVDNKIVLAPEIDSETFEVYSNLYWLNREKTGIQLLDSVRDLRSVVLDWKKEKLRNKH